MKRMLLVLMSVLILVLVSQSVFAAKVNWRLVTHAMPGTEQQKIAEEFAETVKTLSGGDFVISVYPAGVLFPVFETFDNV